jgi:hypothetical protein
MFTDAANAPAKVIKEFRKKHDKPIFKAAHLDASFYIGEEYLDTLSELKLEFSTKELAIEYAKKNKIEFELIEPQKRKIVKKSYADNFTK